jgi:hypothetical protein
MLQEILHDWMRWKLFIYILGPSVSKAETNYTVAAHSSHVFRYEGGQVHKPRTARK